ncbi:hypothetical protein DFH08DRAFT_1024394, partial [Mycena albidolilacea]
SPRTLNPALQKPRSCTAQILLVNPELPHPARGVVRLQRDLVKAITLGLRDGREHLVRHAREAGERARAPDASRARDVADRGVGRGDLRIRGGTGAHTIPEGEGECAPRAGGGWSHMDDVDGGCGTVERGGGIGGGRWRGGDVCHRGPALENARDAPPETLHGGPGAAPDRVGVRIGGCCCMVGVLVLLFVVVEDAAHGAHGGGGKARGGGESRFITGSGIACGVECLDNVQGNALAHRDGLQEGHAHVPRHPELPELGGQIVSRDLHRTGPRTDEYTLQRAGRGVGAADVEICVLEVEGNGAREVEGVLESDDSRHDGGWGSFGLAYTGRGGWLI